MKTVIIPVDFSETSLNAARYAADMFTGKAGTTVILYNMFEKDKESVKGAIVQERCRMLVKTDFSKILIIPLTTMQY